MNETEQKREKNVSLFTFCGENLALDLVNTEIIKRRKRLDLFITPLDVALWWQTACQHHGLHDDVYPETAGEVVYDSDLLQALTTLRTALRALFSALVENKTPDQADVNVLNRVLRTGYSALNATDQGTLLPIYHTTDTHKGPVLLPIALSALRIIETGDHQRLHHCENEHCILFFYDTTRSATRRWCSFGCMDRARSAQRYQQAKQQTAQN
jgi:predicted RNA-binding Zn ribbon-like protein